MGTRIAGVGSAIPSHVLSNRDLEKIVDTSDEWIVSRTGIKERRIVEEGTDTSDLVTTAAKKALVQAQISPEQVDALIVGTATPDTVFPSTACWAQPKIGLRRVPVFDVSAACSGFIYGWIVADSLIKTNVANHVLIVGAEVLSRVMNWKDRSTCVLFGDGAGAILISKNDETSGSQQGLLASSWGADGSLAQLLWQPAGGTRSPATRASVDSDKHTVHMTGNEVFKHAVKAMQRSVDEVLEKAGIKPNDIDLFVPHQANLRIMKATAERSGIPMEKVVQTIDRYGNVSAASIPMALADADAEGRLSRGDLVLSAAFGAGFTWAAALYRW